jgi:hypothetical protein
MCEPQRKRSALLVPAVLLTVVVLAAAPVTLVAGVAVAVPAAEVLAAVVIVAAAYVRLRPAPVPRTVRTRPRREVPAPAITTGQRAIEGRVVSPEDARAALYDEMAPARRP